MSVSVHTICIDKDKKSQKWNERMSELKKIKAKIGPIKIQVEWLGIPKKAI